VDAGIRSGQVHYRLAQLYERQALLPQAATASQESESFGPVAGRDEFYRARGSLLVNQADFDGAVTAYLRRIEVNPNSGEAHRQLGEIYYLQGRHDLALAEFSIAVWLTPADARAHAAAGQVWVRKSNYVEAVTAFRRALSRDGTLREARYGLATSLLRLGEREEAQRELETFQRQQAEAESLGQREFQLDALRREASRESLAGSHDRAITLFREAQVLDPRSARSHRDLGLGLLRAGRPAEAIESLQTAQDLADTAEGVAYLAEAHAGAGDVEAAARLRDRYRESVVRAKLDRIRELAR
jgi:tetratricopeptide (TPR) repeat protein